MTTGPSYYQKCTLCSGDDHGTSDGMAMIMAVMIMVGRMIIDSGSEDDDGRTGLPAMNIVFR